MSKINKPTEFAKARQLYVHEFKSAHYIALLLGLSENTLGKWIKENNWRQDREDAAQSQLTDKSLPALNDRLIEFSNFLKEQAPHLGEMVEPYLKNYLNLFI